MRRSLPPQRPDERRIASRRGDTDDVQFMVARPCARVVRPGQAVLWVASTRCWTTASKRRWWGSAWGRRASTQEVYHQTCDFGSLPRWLQPMVVASPSGAFMVRRDQPNRPAKPEQCEKSPYRLVEIDRSAAHETICETTPALHGRPVGVSTANPARPGSVLIAVNPLAKHLRARKGMIVTGVLTGCLLCCC